jgi:hypothetical protein
MSLSIVALLWALPFLSICIALAVLIIAADWQQANNGE